MATAAITLATSIVGRIFGGMAQRAKQAANENAALQQVIQAYDQAMAQVNQAYNAGQIGPSDVNAEMADLWAWYWQTITPQIQPNRNGCASGSNCPNAATSNGEPAGYCSGDIGATCCVGCGPIRLGMTTVENLMKSGGVGQTSIPMIYGNKYGVQTRPAYTLNWTPPGGSIASVITGQPGLNVGTAGGGFNTRLPGPSIPTSIGVYPSEIPAVPSLVTGVPSAVSPFGISTGMLFIGGAFLVLVLLIARR